MRRLLPAAAIVFSLSLPLLAHPGIDVQIADLTERIAATPNDARLYLRRGELYRLHRDWKEAESDLRHARKIDPELSVVDQSLGRLMLDAGWGTPLASWLISSGSARGRDGSGMVGVSGSSRRFSDISRASAPRIFAP